MKTWQKIIPVEETREDKSYFITRGHGTHGTSYWSEYLNGKQAWSIKPGIAMHVCGGPALVATFAKNPHVALAAMEVPHDAAKRWRRRRHPR